MHSTLRHLLPQAKSSLLSAKTKEREARGSEPPKAAAISTQPSLRLPLELIHKAIDENFSSPRGDPTLLSVGSTCHALARRYRSVCFRVLTLKCSLSDSAASRATAVFPRSVLRYTEELRLIMSQHFVYKKKFALEWWEVNETLQEAPYLRVVKLTISTYADSLHLAKALASLLHGIRNLETLVLRAPTNEALSCLCRSMRFLPPRDRCLPALKNFTTICYMDNRRSHFFRGGEGFSVDLLGGEVFPGQRSLQHLQLGLWRSFGIREQTFLNTYSTTLRCIHLGDRMLPDDPEEGTRDPTPEASVLNVMDLSSLSALETIEILTIHSRFTAALRWISMSVYTLPTRCADTSRPKLRVCLLLNCNKGFLDRRDAWSSQRQRITWQEGLKDSKYGALGERASEVALVAFLRVFEQGRSAPSAPQCLGRYGAKDDSDDDMRYEEFWTRCACSGWTFTA